MPPMKVGGVRLLLLLFHILKGNMGKREGRLREKIYQT